MAKRGRRRQRIIGNHGETGVVAVWRDLWEAATALGTTPGTLRVYMCLDRPYKGYDLDYAPSGQLTLF